MPGLLRNALDVVPHTDDICPKLAAGQRQNSHYSYKGPTSFANCMVDRLMMLDRTRGGFDKRPCRKDEEESCNKVHATCARTLNNGTSSSWKYKLLFDEIKPPCKPPKEGEEGGLGALAGGKAKLPKSDLAGKLGEGSDQADCNSRLVDMPYGLMNPESAKDETKSISQYLGLRLATRVEPSQSVWGLAVHGKSGTFAFDSGGTHISEYIYSIPQGNGLPHDYYVCDSRTHPSACALIGGNLRHACAEWYDPRQCNFCEDHGSSLTCELRGWNSKYLEWAKVPIYPRDLLGEQYKGEFRDVMGSPMYASITIPKWVLRAPVKEMPQYMVQDYEALKEVEQMHLGPDSPPNSLIAPFVDASVPDPVFAATEAFQRPSCVPGCPRQTARDERRDRRRVSARDFF